MSASHASGFKDCSTPVQDQLDVLVTCQAQLLQYRQRPSEVAHAAYIARLKTPDRDIHKTTAQFRAHILWRHDLFTNDVWRDELTTVIGKGLEVVARDVRIWVVASSFEFKPPLSRFQTCQLRNRWESSLSWTTWCSCTIQRTGRPEAGMQRSIVAAKAQRIFVGTGRFQYAFGIWRGWIKGPCKLPVEKCGFKHSMPMSGSQRASDGAGAPPAALLSVLVLIDR